MTTKNNSANHQGQSFRLTKSGWAGQNVRPFWFGEEQELKPEGNGSDSDCVYAGGLNIRVSDNPTKPSFGSKILKYVAHDHPYSRNSGIKNRKKTESLVSNIDRLGGSKKKDSRKEKDISEEMKSTQLYKYLVSPVENRRSVGDTFGHHMVREIINSPSHYTPFARPDALPPVKHAPSVSDPVSPNFLISKSRPIKPVQKIPECQTILSARPHYIPQGQFQEVYFPRDMVLESQPTPTLSVPCFQDVHQKDWTTQQCFEYDLWWQQLPPCQFTHQNE